MQVYPNPDSWDEFYPSEIFIALANESEEGWFPILEKAKIGATITMGYSSTKSYTYKKVGDITALADLPTSIVLLSTAVSANIS